MFGKKQSKDLKAKIEEYEIFDKPFGARRIVLDSVLKSENNIWGGVGYRDAEEETVLTKDGILIEEKTIEYGQFQKTQGGDVTRKIMRRYSLEGSIDILSENPLHIERLKNSV